MFRSPNRLVGVALGVGYLLLGGFGFAVTQDLLAVDGGLLFGVLQVNGLQNLIHLLVGAVLVAGSIVGVPMARATNTAAGTLFLLLGLTGLFLAGNPFNVLAINAADNVLHFGSSVLLLAAGLGAEQRQRGA
ncbi:DUF4383 domain-containing protein [Leifsonia sp. H3M29-4]|uniref:DUF4383 domain-containing protein n=1 Tax=Salinibacterium metalliresistens TaxID=3031321 RepID=UPI0023DA1061|nr:DUF4383 domain-containing protein [Salinibacterium metalliresistens]MDF1477654.1 DUF4383 domain-containing protein [Salinibacterium metalliresistens]